MPASLTDDVWAAVPCCALGQILPSGHRLLCLHLVSAAAAAAGGAQRAVSRYSLQSQSRRWPSS